MERPSRIRRCYFAATIDPYDSDPVFLFTGPYIEPIREAFGRIVGSSVLMALAAEIHTDVIVRFNKPRMDTTVRLIGANTRHYPTRLMREIITLMLERTGLCKVEWMAIDDFINLKTYSYGVYRPDLRS